MHTPTRRPRNRQGGFTLTELLMVIVVIAILASLLLPAISGAVRRARDASVNAEINQMAQALAAFKSQYGDNPPSRILLCENGNYSAFISSSTSMAGLELVPPYPQGSGADISQVQLAQRSLLALRKFWPRVALSTNGTTPPVITNTFFYDFNGNGVMDSPYVLDGRQCLVFFLGGIPINGTVPLGAGVPVGVTGFARNPQNPFQSSLVSNNRTQPQFEFAASRLVPIPVAYSAATPPPLFPAYYDPTASPTGPGYYAYFSSYGGAYDPNDVNVQETDASGNPLGLTFNLQFPVFPSGGTTATNATTSPSPNPYTNSMSTGTAAVNYLNPQSFQIISPGPDLTYGGGGQYLPNANQVFPNNGNDRTAEFDNLTNFHNGRLQ